jgi:hypothetical protein
MTLTSIRLRQGGMTGIEIQSPPLIPPQGGKQNSSSLEWGNKLLLPVAEKGK